jgi:type I restriction enzyme S subunit
MICEGNLPNHFVLHWTRHNMDAILGNANGTTFLEISKSNFRPLPVVVPPREVLNAFSSLATPVHERVVASLRENVTVAALRDMLLPKLLSGEVRVKDAEAAIAASA